MLSLKKTVLVTAGSLVAALAVSCSSSSPVSSVSSPEAAPLSGSAPLDTSDAPLEGVELFFDGVSTVVELDDAAIALAIAFGNETFDDIVSFANNPPPVGLGLAGGDFEVGAEDLENMDVATAILRTDVNGDGETGTLADAAVFLAIAFGREPNDTADVQDFINQAPPVGLGLADVVLDEATYCFPGVETNTCAGFEPMVASEATFDAEATVVGGLTQIRVTPAFTGDGQPTLTIAAESDADGALTSNGFVIDGSTVFTIFFNTITPDAGGTSNALTAPVGSVVGFSAQFEDGQTISVGDCSGSACATFTEATTLTPVAP